MNYFWIHVHNHWKLNREDFLASPTWDVPLKSMRTITKRKSRYNTSSLTWASNCSKCKLDFSNNHLSQWSCLSTSCVASEKVSAKVFVCLVFCQVWRVYAPLITYSGADDSLSVKVFVDFFCSPQAAHRFDKTEPRKFSFWFIIKSNARCFCNHVCNKCKQSGSLWSRCFLNR